MTHVFNMILNWINHDLTIRPVRRIVPCQIQCSQDMIAQAFNRIDCTFYIVVNLSLSPRHSVIPKLINTVMDRLHVPPTMRARNINRYVCAPSASPTGESM